MFQSLVRSSSLTHFTFEPNLFLKQTAFLFVEGESDVSERTNQKPFSE